MLFKLDGLLVRHVTYHYTLFKLDDPSRPGSFTVSLCAGHADRLAQRLNPRLQLLLILDMQALAYQQRRIYRNESSIKILADALIS